MSCSSKAVASLLAGLLVAAPVFTAFAADQTTSAPHAPAAHRHKTRKKRAQLVLPPLPSGPLKQVPMDQIPATAPQVSYQSGLLTIAAENSTLGEILRDVRQLTGAAIDVPPAAGNERVVTHIGPGAPRDILAQLLNGTNFNYVMLGSPSDPAAIATVVLTSKPSGGEVQTAANIYQPPPEAAPPTRMLAPQAFRQQMMTPLGQPQPGAAAAAAAAAGAADAEDAEDADAEDKDDDSDQAQPQSGQVQPDGSATPQGDQAAPDPNQPNGGPKTPEQILEMMRKGQPMVPPPAPPPQQ